MAWPDLVKAWPGLIKAWPGLGIVWPGLVMKSPGSIGHAMHFQFSGAFGITLGASPYIALASKEFSGEDAKESFLPK